MAFLRNMKVSGKLSFGFGLLLIATIVVAVLGIINLATVNTGWSNALEFPNERYRDLFRARYEIMDMRRILFAVAHEAGDDAAIAGRQNEMNVRRTNIAAYFNSYRANLNADPDLTPERAAHLAYVSTQVEAALSVYFTNTADRVFAEAHAGNGPEAYQLVVDGVPALNAIYEQFSYLFAAAAARMYVIGDELNAATAATITVLAIVSVVAVFLAIILAVYITTLISKPLAGLAYTVKQVAVGNMNINFDSNVSKDEIGELTQDVYGLVGVIKSIVNDLSEMEHEFNVVGDFEYRVDTGKYTNSFREMIEGIHAVVDDQTKDIVGVLGIIGQIGDGDFNAEIRNMPGKKAVIPQVLNRVTDTLKNVSVELNAMIKATTEKGDLNFRIDTGSYKGDWQKIMQGLNDIAASVNAPLAEINEVMASLSKGGFDKKITGNYAGDFLALGQSTNETINAVSGYLAEMRNVLTAIAHGDLTQSIDSAIAAKFSERSFTEITNAINEISKQLHKTMSEIHSASEQVLSGAKQISTSAIELANGAQEQASSVEELNATIDMVSQQTRRTRSGLCRCCRRSAHSRRAQPRRRQRNNRTDTRFNQPRGNRVRHCAVNINIVG